MNASASEICSTLGAIMTNLEFYLPIIFVAVILLSILFVRRGKRKSQSGLRRFLWFMLLFSVASLVGHLIRNLMLNPEKFGRRWNTYRKEHGIDTIPSNFSLVRHPLSNWTNYFQKNSSYTLVYAGPDSAGHFRKEIDVTKEGPSREFDFFAKGSDTITKSYIYPNK